VDKNIIEGLCEIYIETGIASEGDDIRDIVLLGRGGVMDSLTALRFINKIERRFGVDIMSDLNLECMESTEKLAAFIESFRGL